jgi:hypothetical protein
VFPLVSWPGKRKRTDRIQSWILRTKHVHRTGDSKGPDRVNAGA